MGYTAKTRVARDIGENILEGDVLGLRGLKRGTYGSNFRGEIYVWVVGAGQSPRSFLERM